MQYHKIPDQLRNERLEIPEGKLNMVLDTDTFNEIDDQFAVVYALQSKERFHVQAIYAAPFHNERSNGPKDGMEKSYEEIIRLLGHMKYPYESGFVLKGSDRYLQSLETPCRNDAVEDLIKRAMSAIDPLYVVAIGAITNIASAILIEPRIVEKIVVVWLGGNALYWPHSYEFNLQQDVLAARVVFDCGVPMILLPCQNVVSHLTTTLAELERTIDGKSAVGSYLTNIVRKESQDHFGYSRVIWDVSTIAYLINPSWTQSHLAHSPVLTDQVTWSVDQRRHFIRVIDHIERDFVFKDLFRRINETEESGRTAWGYLRGPSV